MGAQSTEAFLDYLFIALSHPSWHLLFDGAGFTVGGKPASRPTQPVRLYRGATVDRRRLWSWTTDPEMAAWCAARGRTAREPGFLWIMLAPPEACWSSTRRRTPATNTRRWRTPSGAPGWVSQGSPCRLAEITGERTEKGTALLGILLSQPVR